MAVLRRFGWTAGSAAYTSQGLSGGGTFQTGAQYRHLTSTGLGAGYGLLVSTSLLTVPVTARWMCCDFGQVNNPGLRYGFIFRRGGVGTFAVIVNVAGFIELRRGTDTGAIVATSTDRLIAGNFYWISIELVARESPNGLCNVYIGASTTPIVSFAGDTRQATVDGYDQIEADNVGWRWNDVIIDDTNRHAETFSMSRVVNSDNLTTGWTPSTGATLYGVVDEIPWSSTDYASAVANLDELRCGHVALPTGIAVVGATVMAYFARDGTIVDINLLIVSGGSSSYSGPVAGGAAAAYVGFQHYVDTDPATGAAWTVAALDAALIGARIET